MGIPPGDRRAARDPLVLTSLVTSGLALLVAVAALLIVISDDESAGPAPRAARSQAPSRPPSPVPLPGAPGAPPGGDPPGSTPSGIRPTPRVTRLPWRSEKLRDGSTRMVVGDVDAAPLSPDRVGGTDYRDSGDGAKIVQVRGWWCVTIAPGAPSYSGGYLRSVGFSTQCSGRPGRIRQHWRFTRSSWSGMRGYISSRATPWTSAQAQRSGALAVPCPSGRPGTYDYQLSVTLEIEGRAYHQAAAQSSDRFRGDCGTGVS
jgi:hypothetical protein